MTERIHGDNLFRVGPLWVRAQVDGGFRVGEVGPESVVW